MESEGSAAQHSSVPSTCQICEREINDSGRCPLACSHIFCKECITDYLAEMVRNRFTAAITCAAYQCQAAISEQLIEQLLDSETYQKLLRYRREGELEKDPALRYCPRPGCLGFDHRRKERKLQCGVCHFLFCGDCQTEWHEKGKCPIGPQDAKFLEWKREKGAKFCPGCKVTVEKNGGCPSMRCNRCQYRWCWYCGKKSSGGHICTSLPYSICLLVFFVPIMLPFSFVLVTLHWMFTLRSEMTPSTREKMGHCFYCLLVVCAIFALAVSPICFALFPLVIGYVVLIPCLGSLDVHNRVCSTVIYCLVVPGGLVLGQIVTAGILCVAAVCPIIGLAMMVMKLVGKVCKCKCCVSLMGEAGYPLG